MSYTANTWSKGDLITAAKLNSVETGLASAAETADSAKAAADAAQATADSNAVTVTQTLTSGVQIATINGTKIYAPSYTDGDEVSY